MTTAAEPRTEPIPVVDSIADTGPQQVLELIEQGWKVRQIAEALHVAPSTVSRWKAKASEEQQASESRIELRWTRALIVIAIVFTLVFMVLTAAVGSMAWG